MYNSLYPASWFVSNQAGKNSFLLTYGDLPFVPLEHLATLLPVHHQQQQQQHHQQPMPPMFSASQVAFDMLNMKHLPVNMLMQSMESVNTYMPFFRRRNVNLAVLDRQTSKESLSESAGGDSGVSSSRSSTPSSVDTSRSDELRNSPPSIPAPRPRKKFEHDNSSQGQNNHRRVQQQRHYTKMKAGGIFMRIPQNIKDEWQKASLGIWDHYVRTRQKDDILIKKMDLRAAVHTLLGQIFPNCGLRVVGSSVNGLGTNTSDVDMCLVLPSTIEIDQQTEALHLLQCAQRLLNHCSFVKSTDLITAKVPILKFTEKHNNIQVDLNINNTVGIANTQLLGSYTQLDWRVPPLVLVIKKWAQDCKINNAKEMTLSSYSLVLMVMHYLQCGCDPPVLPCLQKMQSRRYESGDYWKFVFPFSDAINFQSMNTQSLGSLLYGFFDYYTEKFDFSKDVISVRLGCKLSKQVAMNFRSVKNKRGHWKFICIEEPFNRTNTACAVYDQDSFNRIMNAFKTTWIHLRDKKEIGSVLSPPPKNK